MRRPGTKEPRCGLTNMSLELSYSNTDGTPPKSVSSALRWQIPQNFLRLPLLQCGLLPPIQVGPLLLDAGQLQISRLTPLQKMKYIQIKCKIHQKMKTVITHIPCGRHFFLTCKRYIEGFVNFVYFINFWTREQAQSQVCKQAEWTTNVINGHYMLASPSTKANGIKQMSQTQTPGQSKSCFGKRQF